MSIVTQTDKRTGITYAYDTTYYWDKEKRQSRSKRICVGKIDPETGDIVPTRGRAKKGSKSASGKPEKNQISDSFFPKHTNSFYLWPFI